MSRFFGWNGEEVGTLFSGLPSPVGFRWEPSDVWNVLPAAFGLAFVSSVDLLMTSRVVEHFRGRQKLMKKHDADMELGAYGIGNLVGGIFGAPTSVGIPARSLANVQCGASTAISNFIHAVLLVGLLIFGTHLLAQIPRAALAGVTVWMGARLLGLEHLETAAPDAARGCRRVCRHGPCRLDDQRRGRHQHRLLLPRTAPSLPPRASRRPGRAQVPSPAGRRLVPCQPLTEE